MEPEVVSFHHARLICALYDVLGAKARAKAESVMDKGMPFDRACQIVTEEAAAMRAKGMDEDAIRRSIRHLRELYSRAVACPPNERSSVVLGLMHDALEAIMKHWIDRLNAVQVRMSSDEMFLRLLDDAMLPPMDPETQAEFARLCYRDSLFREAEVRQGLRELRRRLPAGTPLHPDAMALLGIAAPAETAQPKRKP